MGQQEPRDHHYAPQFYLRNFAADPERLKIDTVAKNGPMAVWSQRSIESLGYERDFYVHTVQGAPVSVETRINQHLETPISSSETWRKITSGETSALDHTDRAVLYALIRHLHARTPHARETTRQMAEMAASAESEIPFSRRERALYSDLRSTPDGPKAYQNVKASNLAWAREDFAGSLISVMRSPIPLNASTTPVIAIKAPGHPALSLLPGMTPYTLLLPLTPHTMAMLVIGDFDGHFSNRAISEVEAMAFNKQFVGQFAFFDTIRHLITPRDGLIEALTWAPYDFVAEDARKLVFRRRDE